MNVDSAGWDNHAHTYTRHPKQTCLHILAIS